MHFSALHPETEGFVGARMLRPQAAACRRLLPHRVRDTRLRVQLRVPLRRLQRRHRPHVTASAAARFINMQRMDLFPYVKLSETLPTTQEIVSSNLTLYFTDINGKRGWK